MLGLGIAEIIILLLILSILLAGPIVIIAVIFFVVPRINRPADRDNTASEVRTGSPAPRKDPNG